ncbi:hypothetical protein CEUSTIGMA_g2126.t1 [Chlamydomonas eustigma]|uniref:Tyrosine-protein kinase ephrin type A/B receptor-like domain-containing protein n=1 Tax=Chlamydomonas eustigma TaxID=1157962 RepID=A0A250WV27_9CHLO|nr:hypothetical protein CEUSTIGMA_g2126.t1 [Chlamydomonas eustigma]|eukprot:GAX74678.1 hypothetical protein CEUSTIGMA_g2126.t1 [Chlamydomonas eustigma]
MKDFRFVCIMARTVINLALTAGVMASLLKICIGTTNNVSLLDFAPLRISNDGAAAFYANISIVPCDEHEVFDTSLLLTSAQSQYIFQGSATCSSAVYYVQNSSQVQPGSFQISLLIAGAVVQPSFSETLIIYESPQALIVNPESTVPCNASNVTIEVQLLRSPDFPLPTTVGISLEQSQWAAVSGSSTITWSPGEINVTKSFIISLTGPRMAWLPLIVEVVAIENVEILGVGSQLQILDAPIFSIEKNTAAVVSADASKGAAIQSVIAILQIDQQGCSTSPSVLSYSTHLISAFGCGSRMAVCNQTATNLTGELVVPPSIPGNLTTLTAGGIPLHLQINIPSELPTLAELHIGLNLMPVSNAQDYPLEVQSSVPLIVYGSQPGSCPAGTSLPSTMGDLPATSLPRDLFLLDCCPSQGSCQSMPMLPAYSPTSTGQYYTVVPYDGSCSSSTYSQLLTLTRASLSQEVQVLWTNCTTLSNRLTRQSGGPLSLDMVFDVSGVLSNCTLILGLLTPAAVQPATTSDSGSSSPALDVNTSIATAHAFSKSSQPALSTSPSTSTLIVPGSSLNVSVFGQSQETVSIVEKGLIVNSTDGTPVLNKEDGEDSHVFSDLNSNTGQVTTTSEGLLTSSTSDTMQLTKQYVVHLIPLSSPSSLQLQSLSFSTASCTSISTPPSTHPPQTLNPPSTPADNASAPEPYLPLLASMMAMCGVPSQLTTVLKRCIPSVLDPGSLQEAVVGLLSGNMTAFTQLQSLSDPSLCSLTSNSQGGGKTPELTHFSLAVLPSLTNGPEGPINTFPGSVLSITPNTWHQQDCGVEAGSIMLPLNMVMQLSGLPTLSAEVSTSSSVTLESTGMSCMNTSLLLNMLQTMKCSDVTTSSAKGSGAQVLSSTSGSGAPQSSQSTASNQQQLNQAVLSPSITAASCAIISGLQRSPLHVFSLPISVEGGDRLSSRTYMLQLASNVTLMEAKTVFNYPSSTILNLTSTYEELVLNASDSNAVNTALQFEMYGNRSASLPASPLQSCALCPRGFHTSSLNQVGCVPCPPGQYAESPLSSSCQSCPPGTYANTWGAYTCSVCLVGSYSNSSDAQSCIICPSGTTSIQPGSTACPVVIGNQATGGDAGQWLSVSFDIILKADPNNVMSLSPASTGLQGSWQSILVLLLQLDIAEALNVSMSSVALTAIVYILPDSFTTAVTVSLPMSTMSKYNMPVLAVDQGRYTQSGSASSDGLNADPLIQSLVYGPDAFQLTSQATGGSIQVKNVQIQVMSSDSGSGGGGLDVEAIAWPSAVGGLLLGVIAGLLWRKRRSFQMLSPPASCCCCYQGWAWQRRNSLDDVQTYRLWPSSSTFSHQMHLEMELQAGASLSSQPSAVSASLSSQPSVVARFRLRSMRAHPQDNSIGDAGGPSDIMTANPLFFPSPPGMP